MVLNQIIHLQGKDLIEERNFKKMDVNKKLNKIKEELYRIQKYIYHHSKARDNRYKYADKVINSLSEFQESLIEWGTTSYYSEDK